jgi:fimbrial isopeptide formation D2 family protein/uncharacterized repeat protein (TIGR01451 family)/LPXTG-motif cell wall-anchored protein
VRSRTHRAGAPTPVRSATSVAVVLALLAGLLTAFSLTAASPSAAAPGNPGTPGPSRVLFTEDFENAPNNSNLLLTGYTGASGAKYTGDAFWVSRNLCNGLIIQQTSPRVAGDCRGSNADSAGVSAYDNLTALPWALAGLGGFSDRTLNAAASSFTSGTGTANAVQFRTQSPITLPAANRFVTFSVDAAAASCQSTHPQLRFYLSNSAGVETPVSSAAIDPCNDPRSTAVTARRASGGESPVRMGRFAANGSTLVTGNTLGIVLRNENGNGAGNDGAYDNIRVLDVTPQLDKSFSPASVPVGGRSTLTLTVTNTDELAAKSGWAFTDSLPDGLTVASPVATGGTCNATVSASGSTIGVTNGQLAANQRSCTITVDVTSQTPNGADPSPKTYQNCAANISNVVGIDLPGCASVSFFSTPELTVTKASDATAATRVGDTVNYTVTAKNTGTGDYTTANPARVLDDLSKVLDDATYNEDAAAAVGGSGVAAPTYNAPRLSWSGPLAAGASVSITYSVKLKAGGDGTVTNTAFAPGCNPASSGCSTTPPAPAACDTSIACDRTSFALPRLTIEKSADRQTLPAVGEKVTYTVVATNSGPGDYTAGAPAHVVDDLTKVLDDATFDTASLTSTPPGATYSEPRITWSGPLASGASVRFTYTVTYTGEGDSRLVNTAFGPPDPDDETPQTCTEGAAVPCDTVQVPGAQLNVSKSVNPVSGTTVNTGDLLTYTLTFDNDGTADASVDHTDYLDGVLDDAELVSGPTAAGPLTAALTGGELVIGGSVPAGETRTVTYTVRVLSAAERGDDVLRNFLQPAGDPPPAPGEVCEPDSTLCTTNPVAQPVDFKTVDPADGTTVGAGQQLTYTLTFRNRGQGTAALDRVDDLTHVLDDATVTSAPAVTSGTGVTVSAIADGRFSITGGITAGDTVVVKYTVTVKDNGSRGDDVLGNFLLNPDRPTPSDPSACAADNEDCTVNPVSQLVDSKSVDPDEGTTVSPGQVLTYTLTFRNAGQGTAPVDRVDDLTHVLDDAELTAGPTSSDDALTAVRDGVRLQITGELAAGQTVTVTYRVRVKAAADLGDSVLANFLLDPDETVPAGPADCADGDPDCTTNPVSQLVDSKSVDPADGSSVVAGQVLTYTLTFRNAGQGTAPVDRVDDLTHVLDDATVTTDPAVASGSGVTVSSIAGRRFSITGGIAAGQTVTVTYQVTVKANGARGDDSLGNFLLDPDDTVPSEPTGCATGDADCTVNPVSQLVDSKSVNPADGTTVTPGQELTYTLTFRNTGQGTAVVDRVDDLSGILDDAELVEGPTSSDDALAALRDGNRIEITGDLAAGQTVTVTYRVKVRAAADLGDSVLGNFLLDPDETVPDECAAADPDCTVNPVSQLVDSKSVDPADRTTVVAGQVLTYTLTFRNAGKGTAVVDRVDDLTRVLDDAELTSGPTSSDDALSVVRDGGRLSITGGLAADQTVTITYQVTVKGNGSRGDDSLDNFLLDPDETVPTDCATGDGDCTVNPVSQLVDSKSVDPAEGTTVTPGQELTYTLTFRNAGKGTAVVDRVDDLTHVLDDADLVSGPTSSGDALEAVRDGTRLEITGGLAAGQTVTVTYKVKVHAVADLGDSVLGNFLLAPDDDVPADPADCDTDDADCTTNPIAQLVDSKSVDPVDRSTVVAGQVLTYTLTFRNAGQGAAVVDRVDDLTNVLDDATVTTAPAVASGSGLTVSTVADGRFSITGAVAAGQTVTVTYRVTVKADGSRGDDSLGNFLLDPDEDVPSDCATGDGDCTVNPVSQLVDSKSVDPEDGTTVKPGQQLTYTLTFRNAGKGTAVVDRVDDLAGILDDADLVSGPTSSDDALKAVRDGERLEITGGLAAGQSVTVTYTVTVKAAADLGDSVLGNFLLDPDEEVPDDCAAGDADCTVNPVAQLVDSKSVDPKDGTTVKPGQELTYTLTFRNAGQGTAVVDRVDDLTHVLDDADLVSGPTSSDDALEAVRDGKRAEITGGLTAGQTVTVTYRVKVRAAADLGDSVLGNFLLDPDEKVPAECAADDADCTTNPIAQLVDSKSVDPADRSTVEPGQVLTYTLTFRNAGQGTAVVDRVDDLTHVVDDATVTTAPAVASGNGLTVSPVADRRFAITGGVAAGQTVTITYQVTVKGNGDRGDDVLGNYLIDPDQTVPTDPTACSVGNADCTVNPVSQLVDSKSVDPEDGTTVRSGDELTYTLTFRNSGQGTAVVDRVDELTHVLDDADLVSGPTSSGRALDVVRDGKRLTITGGLTAGQTVTVTYKVKVHAVSDLGDSVLGNYLIDPDETVPTDPTACSASNPDCTVNPVSQLVDSKSVDPEDGTTVKPGQQLTYTLTFRNAGQGTAVVDRVDDLTHVVDDADLVSGPTSSDTGLEAVRDGKRLEITGGVAAGTTVTVTYTVKVKAADQVGDSVLSNFLLDPDQTVPTDPTACAKGDDDCTTNPLPAPEMRVVKKMSAPDDAGPGDVVTYTVTATNTGSVDYPAAKPARFTDDFTKVLDDADYAGDAKASTGTVAYDAPTLTWSGPLRTGQTVTVTYSFTIHDPLDGDGKLVNVVVTPDGVNGNCEVGDRDESCGTVMGVSDRAPDAPVDGPKDDNGILPETGGFAWWLLVAGLIGLFGGSVLLVATRRRR